MATIAFAAAGAAVGSAFGATALGWQIGAMVGGYLMTPDAPPVEGPRLSDLTVQSADYGGPIPKNWGTMRVGTQVIGSSEIIETKHTEEVGGKGGPSYTQTSYTYAISMALSLCEGPITGVRNIYANGRLIWTADPNDVTSIDNAVPNVAIYLGTEDQSPDPMLESVYGAGNVPAYRGISYISITNFQLGEYGNQVPQIECEVVVDGTLDDNMRLIAEVENPEFEYWAGLDGASPAIMRIEDGIIEVLCAETGFGFSDSETRQNTDIILYFDPSSGVIGSRKVNFLEINATGWEAAASLAPEGIGIRSTLYQGSFVYRTQYSAQQTAVWVDRNENKLNATGSSFGYPTRPQVYVGPYKNGNNIIADKLTDFDGYLTQCCLLPDQSGVFIAWGPTQDTSNAQDTVGWMIIDSDGNILRQGTCGADVQIKGIDPYGGSIAFESASIFWTIGRYSIVGLGTRYINSYEIGADDVIRLIKNDDFTITSLGHLPSAMVAKNGVVYAVALEKLWAWSRLPSVTSDDYPVADIISDLCEQGGLGSSDIDVSDVTETIRGYARTKPMTIRGAIEPLQQARFFDAVESDWNLKFISRGNASIVSIPEDDLAANTESSSTDDAVSVTRKQDMELPFEITVKYLDEAFDYQPNAQRSGRIITTSKNTISTELPMSLNADDAAQISEVLLFNAWQERTTFSMKLPPEYEYLDPTDVVTVTENGNTHVLRITGMRVGEYIELDAVSEEPSTYTSTATGFERVGSQSLAGAGPTNATTLDIPLLRNQDNSSGFYVAASGFTNGWNGAVWYSSNDAGTTYAQEAVLDRSATQGLVQSTLNTDSLASVIDYASTVTVNLGTGSLSSITDAQLLDGVSNAAAIGDDGRWEIVQFKNATLNADGTYTLDTFVRGRKGTEWAIALHEDFETFVLLNTNLSRQNLNTDEIGVSRYYKAVTFNKLIDTTPEIEFTLNAISLKPYAPAHLEATDNGDGTFTATWIRRDRMSGEWRDLVDVPMSEQTESYRVIVERSGSQISSTDVSSETASVTAQAADVIKVAQVSAIVGAGYYSEITV